MKDLIEWYTEHYAEINATAGVYMLVIDFLLLIVLLISNIKKK